MLDKHPFNAKHHPCNYPFPSHPLSHLNQYLPICAIRAPTKHAHPAIRDPPAKICAYSYPPPFLWISCPAIGGPVNTAKLTIVNTMPIRVPIIFRSVVNELRVAGKSDWMAAPTMP